MQHQDLVRASVLRGPRGPILRYLRSHYPDLHQCVATRASDLSVMQERYALLAHPTRNLTRDSDCALSRHRLPH